MGNKSVKYEYRVIDTDYPDWKNVQEVLNKLGDSGFKIVAKYIKSETTYLILQKEINE